MEAGSLQVHYPWDEGHPLTLPASQGLGDFVLWHSAPVVGGLALLGELGKFVPVAEARFEGLAMGSGGLEVGVRGSAGEAVEVSVFDAAAGRVYTVPCVLGGAGVARLVTAGAGNQGACA